MRATDIDEQIEARLAPYHVEGDPGHQVLIAEDPGAASTPLVLAQVRLENVKSTAIMAVTITSAIITTQ